MTKAHGHRPKQHGLGKRGSFGLSVAACCMGSYDCCMGVPIIGPGGIKRGLLPKVFDPTCRSTRCTAYLSMCSPFGVSKNVFLEKTSIGVRGSFSLHGNHWYGSGMAVTVAYITVSFRCRCANGDDCDDDIWPTYTEFVPPHRLFTCVPRYILFWPTATMSMCGLSRDLYV